MEDFCGHKECVCVCARVRLACYARRLIAAFLYMYSMCVCVCVCVYVCMFISWNVIHHYCDWVSIFEASCISLIANLNVL